MTDDEERQERELDRSVLNGEGPRAVCTVAPMEEVVSNMDTNGYHQMPCMQPSLAHTGSPLAQLGNAEQFG
jgi:hypothetical protein